MFRESGLYEQDDLRSGVAGLLDGLMGARQSSWQIAFDGSGPITESDTHYAYGGVVGSAAAWVAFTERWLQILDQHNLDYVRMVEAMNFRGVFTAKANEWGQERVTRRDALLLELVKLTPIFDLRAIGLALQPGGLKEQQAALRKREVFQAVISQVLADHRDRQFVLLCDTEQDSADHFRGWLSNLQQRDENSRRIVALCFGDDKFFPPLQLADVAAYLLREDAERVRFRPDEPMNPLTVVLRGNAPAAVGRILNGEQSF